MDPLVIASTRFAEAVYQKMRQKRYGLKSCTQSVDPEKVQDMMALYRDQTERVSANLLETQGCTISTLSERLCNL